MYIPVAGMYGVGGSAPWQIPALLFPGDAGSLCQVGRAVGRRSFLRAESEIPVLNSNRPFSSARVMLFTRQISLPDLPSCLFVHLWWNKGIRSLLAVGRGGSENLSLSVFQFNTLMLGRALGKNKSFRVLLEALKTDCTY